MVASVLVSIHAARSIELHGIKGYVGAGRLGVLGLCAGSWAGLWRSGTPLTNDGRRVGAGDGDVVRETV